MNISWDTDIYCLIGNPISKTLSPIIHNNFYKISNINNVYLAFDVEKENLEHIVKSLKILKVKGFNVTLPYKISIMKYLDDISKEAKIINAVNTVKNENGKLIGYNTDCGGFLKSLELNNIDVKGKVVLILGAGGAANAISTSLALAGAKKIYINNRTLIKAEKLAKRIKNQFSRIIVEWGDLELNNICKNTIDMVVNCTSIGMYPDVEKSPMDFKGFSKDLIVYDIIYKPRNTKFLQIAKERDNYTIGGLSMLINQALYSQKIWLENNNGNIFHNFNIIERILGSFVE